MRFSFPVRRSPSALMPLFAALLFFCALSSAAVAKDNWLRLKTKNFTVVGNADEKDLRRVANNLEQFRNVFSQILKLNLTVSEPMTIIVFKSDGSFKPYKPLYQGKPASVGGYFQRTPDGIYIALGLTDNNAEQFEVIFHEYVHLILSNNLPNVPLWFNEGLAEYYSTLDFTSKDDAVGVGKHINNHVFYLRDRGTIPLRTLFAVNHDSPQYNERSKQGVFYAQSWALLHYLLLDKQAARQKQVGQFVDLLRGGMEVEKAVAQAFQMTIEQMEKELRAYINRNSYPYLSIKLDVKATESREAQIAPLSDATAHAYLADLTRGLQRTDKAEEEVQFALQADPRDPLANAVASRLHLRAGKSAEARAAIQTAIAADPQNYLWHYYLASVINAETLAAGNGRIQEYAPEDRAAIKAAIDKSLALNPNFAQALALSAFIKLITKEDLAKAAVELQRAARLQPERTDYYFTLVQVYVEQKNFAGAHSLLRTLKTREQSSARQQRLQQLDDFVSQSENYSRRVAEDLNTQKSAPGAPPPANAPGVTSGSDDSDFVISDPAPSIRPLAEGEQRVTGLLVKIDCNSTGAQLVLKDASGKLLRFDAGDMSSVSFITYVEAGGQITCGERSPANPVIVSYRPSDKSKNGALGTVVAVEFVPPDFKLPQ